MTRSTDGELNTNFPSMALPDGVTVPEANMDQITAERPPAFLWTREFSLERLKKIERLNWTWERLFDEPGDRGHYARFQWVGLPHEGVRTEQAFDGYLQGEKCKIHLRLITTKEWFVRQLYESALQKTYLRYPGFDQRKFIDGPRIGERRLEFLSETYELAWGHLWIALWHDLKDDPPKVGEAIFTEPCSTWGYTTKVAASKRYGCDFSAEHKRLTFVQNKEKISQEDVEVLKSLLKEGRLPELNSSLVTFPFDEIRDGFIELSAPELVALNWADARRPFTRNDLELLDAVKQLDRSRIEQAIADGAELNLIDEGNDNILSIALDAWYSHREYLDASDENLARWGITRPEREVSEDELCALMKYLIDAGAHPDLMGPCEPPIIVNASLACSFKVMKLLLDVGANSSVDWAWDSYPGEWPQAWDSPSFDAHHEHDDEARRVYDLLLLNRPSPIYERDREIVEIGKAHLNLGLEPTWKYPT